MSKPVTQPSIFPITTPTISIVCGTYNRLKTLIRLVDSVRLTLNSKFATSVVVEFIIADNASTDGTWGWLQAQPDIKAIQMGAPVGAIKAFTEAAKYATGDYVVLATDDIWFPPNALLKALRYLESTPRCGAVAFMHNKDGHFHTDRQKARTASGAQTGIIYPQICMVRRWLGDLAGWWGGEHPHMKNSFTYGGDNFLGSRIVELGYTVDEVDGCIDFEDVIQDAPRKLNSDRHQHDFDNYWSLYPDGPTIADTPQVENPQCEKLRVLLALHYESRFPQHKQGKIGMTIALRKLGHVTDYDYAAVHEAGNNVTDDITRLAEAWQPHLVFVQAHNMEHGFPMDAIPNIRNVAPRVVCVNWNGDYWPQNIEKLDTQTLYKQFDLIVVQTLYLQERLCEMDICSAYIPHSFEPCIPLPDAPAHDVVWAGNGYTEYRQQLIALLAELPYNVGLYGRCATTQMTGDTYYHFGLQSGIYRNSLIAVGEMHFDHHTGRGFVSNRLWETMAAGGALCLQQYVPMLSELTGLLDGIHLVYWHEFDDLREKIDYYMAHPNEARRIAQAAYEAVHRDHNFDVRMRKILTEILPQKLCPSEPA